MSGEIPSLTPEKVALAEKRVGLTHPVIDVLDKNLPILTQLNKRYEGIKDNQEAQRYVREHYSFLADDLVAAGEFPLDPLDIIAIWSRAFTDLPYYQRHAFAGMVSSAYAIQGLDNPHWKKYPRHYSETYEIPQEVIDDKSGLMHVRERLDQIGVNIKEIDFYIYGVRGSAMQLAGELTRKEMAGDLDAKKRLEDLIAHQNTHMTPVLGEIHENFGNGYVPLYFVLNPALKALDEPIE